MATITFVELDRRGLAADPLLVVPHNLRWTLSDHSTHETNTVTNPRSHAFDLIFISDSNALPESQPLARYTLPAFVGVELPALSERQVVHVLRNLPKLCCPLLGILVWLFAATAGTCGLPSFGCFLWKRSRTVLNELRQRHLPSFLIVVRQTAEFLRVHAQFSCHLHVSRRQMVALRCLNPKLILRRLIHHLSCAPTSRLRRAGAAPAPA